MKVEIGKTPNPETPASRMAEYVTEKITALMTLGGIESIVAKKYTCGFGSKLHVSIAPFADAPAKIAAQGVIIKDALAQIMSVANINKIEMKPSDKDLRKMRETWTSAVQDADDANGGSSQFSGKDPSGAATES